MEYYNSDRSALDDVLKSLSDYFIPKRRVKRRHTILGKGGFATVRLAELRPDAWVQFGATPSMVAVKELVMDHFNFPPIRLALRLAREMKIWASCKHPNILEFTGYYLSSDYQEAYLVSPYLKNGNMKEYLTRENPGMEQRLKFVLDTAKAVQYLHAQDPPILHGDLKTLNVLVSDEVQAVLCDFAQAGPRKDKPTGLSTSEGFKGTIRFSSPEILRGLRTGSSDIWAWGCLLLEIVTGRLPYYEVQSDNQVLMLVCGREDSGKTPEPSDSSSIPPDVLRLLRKCWSWEPEERPAAENCLRSVVLTLFRHSEDISRFITNLSPQPIFTNGGFGDIFKGVSELVGEVALKRIKISVASNETALVRRVMREADTWRLFAHPHILDFLGTFNRDGHLYLVSPFIQNGTLLQYINDRRNVSRIKLLCQAADALSYLHRENIVHGDIKASNILVGDDGGALLCDFGLTKFTDAHTSTAMSGAGTGRWQSPELWDNVPKSFQSDVYAFSMTIVEVLTGNMPFPHLLTQTAVIKAVAFKNERPAKIPMDFNGVSYENAWAIAEACWQTEPEDRIPISEAFRRLSEDPSLL